MSHLDFKNIQVVKDNVNDIDVIRDIIKTEKPEDAFYVMDVGDIIKRHQEWISKMPKVVPHYGMSVAFVIFFFLSLFYCCVIFEMYCNKSYSHSIFQISAIKCNSNSTVIKVLAALNAFFDCASKVNIRFYHRISKFRCLYYSYRSS